MADEGSPIRGLAPSAGAKGSMKNEWSAFASTFLESIPADTDPPVEVQSLAQSAGWPIEESEGFAAATVSMLSALGTIDVIYDSSGATLIRSISRSALYLNHSIAAHLREELPILTDWTRPPSPDGPVLANDTLRGPDFLYLIEKRRLTNPDSKPIPLRSTEVCQAIIKARTIGSGNAGTYLVQFDKEANQYQLIGGHRRKDDKSLSISMRREIREELKGNRFVFDRTDSEDSLREIYELHSVEISRTTGASTAYAVHMYLYRTKKTQLILDPGDKWVSEKELLQGTANDGKRIANDFVLELDAGYAGGIHGLGWSLDSRQARRLIDVYRARRWESWGLIVGIIGLILTVIFFILT